MIKINVLKVSNIKKIYILLITILALTMSIKKVPVLLSNQKSYLNFSEKNIKSIINSACIYIDSADSSQYLNNIFSYFLFDNIKSSQDIINSQVILLKKYSSIYTKKSIIGIDTKLNENTPQTSDDEKENKVPITRQIISSDKVTISNQTNFKVDISKLKKEPLSFNLKKEAVNVLIYHTHTTESYTSSSRNYYLQNGYFRTTNLKYTVAEVGNELYNQLKKKKILSYHNKTVHDSPAYSGAYRRSLETITNDLNKYNEAKIVLDLHRDAFGNGNHRLITKVNNTDVAQIMFVVGTNGLGLKHDKWSENLKFVIKLQETLNSKYPNLCRPIDLREERFNQHVTPGAIIVEVGCTGNTLEEATLSMKYLAEGISTIMNK